VNDARSRLDTVIAAAVVLAALAGCGGGSTVPGGKPDSKPIDDVAYPGDADGDSPDGAPGEAVGDAVDEPGDAAGEAGDGPGPDAKGGVGAPCGDGDDCESGFCAATRTGMACAAPCDDGACPPGWQCRPAATGGHGLCIEPDATRCRPCGSDKDCAAAPGLVPDTCLSFPDGAGSFCVTSCGGDGCPEDWGCTEAGLCTPPDWECECSPLARAQGFATACLVTSASGACPGERRCTGTGLGPCEGPPPGPEACNGKDDDCDGGTDEDTCDDDEPCTVDSCDPAAGCVNAPADLACDDGDPCTTTDACAEGKCVGAGAKDCDDGDPCTTTDACAEGKCVGAGAKDCDDGDPCTTDACDKLAGCVHVQNHEPCDDHDPCTVGDACAAGKCAPGTPRDCDDLDPCTEDSCDASYGGCVNDGAPLDGAPCDADGDGCTVGDACSSGDCVPGPAEDCSAVADACNDGACVPGGGPNEHACVKVPARDLEPCDDGLFCIDGETCLAGTCLGGGPIDCSASDGPCGVGKCNEDEKRCVTDPFADGVPCEDPDGCTAGDACDDGVCEPGEAIDCSRPEDPCNTWVCVSAGPGLHACEPTPIAGEVACDDGDACTLADRCDGAGRCVAGTVRDCSSLTDACGDGACDPETGECGRVPRPDGTPCDDGDACTAIDACKAGACKGSGTACGDLKVSEGATGYAGLAPAVVPLGDGRAVVAWLGSNVLRGRSLAADGSREGAEVMLSAAANVPRPLVTDLPGGTFAVGTYGVWNACSCSNDCKDMGTECVAGSCNATGNIPHKKCSWQQWNTVSQAVWSGAMEPSATASFTLHDASGAFACQECPSQPGWTPLAVGGLRDGNLAWLWRRDSDQAVIGRVVKPDWTPVADLGTVGTNWPGGVAIAASAAPGGGFLVAWGDGTEVRADVRNAAGTRIAGPFTVPTVTGGVQEAPSAVGLPGGGFVVAWATEVAGQGTDVAFQVLGPTGTKVGGQGAAHVATAGNQRAPAVAAFADGSFAVAFQDDSGRDGSGSGVLARTFAADGTAIADERVVARATVGDQVRPGAAGIGDAVLVAWNGSDGSVLAARIGRDGLPVAPVREAVLNWTKAGDQREPAAAALPGGGWVSAWTSDPPDGEPAVVYRLVGADGAASPETVVGTGASPAPAVAADGPFVVAWTTPSGDGIRVRRFGATGEAGGDEAVVEGAGTAYVSRAAPAAAAVPGGFLVAWEAAVEGGAGADVRVRCLDAFGLPVGSEAAVDAAGTARLSPAAAAIPAGTGITGGAVVAWQAKAPGASTWDVVARSFGAGCSPAGPAIVIGPSAGGPGGPGSPAPAVAALPAAAGGGYLVAWAAPVAGLGQGVVARRVSPDGSLPAGPITVASGLASTAWPAATALPGGAFLVAWEAIGADEDLAGVAARRIAADGTPDPLSRVLSLTYKGAQGAPAVAAAASGTAVLASWRSAAQDGDAGAIVRRLFPSW